MIYCLARSAASDIDEIADRIDAQNPAAALHFVEGLHGVFEMLGRHPFIGHVRTDLTDRPVRFWIALRRYAVVYEAGPPVTIVHVRDWRRDPSTLID